MSPGPDPQVDVSTIEQTRRHIQRLFEEVARLSELDLAPNDYFGEFLKRVLTALAAPAGAVWMRTPQGNLQLQYQINLQNLGLNQSDEARQAHDELLRVAFQQPRPLHLPPNSLAGQPEQGRVAPGNPTEYTVLLVPIQVENQVDGLIEVWQNPDRNPNAINGFLQFMVEMSQLASRYLRNRLMRQMAGQQALWTQLEAFTRQIHSSLNPVETAYVIANEGRRLIDCDRVNIGVRYSRKCRVEAVSGADVVERRSNLVQLMQKLFDRVLAWNEKLVYSGAKDETLPPDVLAALDAYLAESNSKLLVVQPLRDERDKESKKPARSVMMMECFEPTATPDQLVARMDVVGKHAGSALYNCVEHRRIPFRFLWMPLAKVQEGLGGKTRAIITLIVIGLAALAAVMVLVPYPLKISSTGSLLPEVRQFVYPPRPGQVEKIEIDPGARVLPGQNLLLMRDGELAQQLIQLDNEISQAEREVRALEGGAGGSDVPEQERHRLDLDRIRAESTLRLKRQVRSDLIARTNAVDLSGHLWVKSPGFPEGRPLEVMPGHENVEPAWTVLTPDFKEMLLRRPVETKDPVLRLGFKEGRWEVEMKIPQKHIGQVLQAFDRNEGKALDVELIVKTDPTRHYYGKLEKSRVALEATPHRSDNDESEPVVLAWVRIDGTDIPPDRQIPPLLLLAGSEVRAKVDCGNHAMGYSLFYGVWEFFYEKVVFFF